MKNTCENKGIALGHETVWVVKGVSDPEKFFAELPKILPEGVILYFEGVAISDGLRSFFEEAKIDPTTKVMGGTITPKPSIFHVPASFQNFERLCKLTKNVHGYEVCDHFHVYKENRMLVQWFDAWECPIGFSSDFSEAQIKSFCVATGGKFERYNRKNL